MTTAGNLIYMRKSGPDLGQKSGHPSFTIPSDAMSHGTIT